MKLLVTTNPIITLHNMFHTQSRVRRHTDTITISRTLTHARTHASPIIFEHARIFNTYYLKSNLSAIALTPVTAADACQIKPASHQIPHHS